MWGWRRMPRGGGGDLVSPYLKVALTNPDPFFAPLPFPPQSDIKVSLRPR